MSWLLAFLGFALLIIFHEAGHFAAAKAVGMRVERFVLFLGTPVISFRRGETEYGIAPIPLGGYVKISGMNPNEELPADVAPRSYFRQPVWKRLVVIAAGPAVNLVLAFLILWVLGWAQGKPVLGVDRVEPGTPAAAALRPGDKLLAVDGRQGDVIRQIGTHRCAGAPRAGCRATTPASLLIDRAGARRTLALHPFYDGRRRAMRVGFGLGPAYVPQGPVAAAGTSVGTMWRVTSATLGVLGRLFYDPQARKQLSGVVGSYEVTRQAVKTDLTVAAYILALISLSLAVVNLFPFLPLDGGHIFWALAEKVRGRAIPFRIMERASIVGFALVAVLFVIGFTNDITRLTNGGIHLQ